MKENEIRIIPASEVKERQKPKPKDYNNTIKELNKKIEAEKYLKEIYVLSLPPEVVEMLEGAGYFVKFLPACGMGDMDSHLISWK